MREFLCAFIIISLVAISMFAFLPELAQAQNDSRDFTPAAKQVVEMTKARKKAYERGDVSAWALQVADDCSFIDAAGRLASKAQFMAGVRPAVGYTFSAVLNDIRATDFGGTIVLRYRETETWDFGQQRTGGTYLDTETYVRMNNDWKLTLWTETLVPQVPRIVKIDPAVVGSYVGTYAVNGEVTFTVTRQDDRLFGQYSGENRFEMFPANKSTFFRDGDSAALIFLHDKSGQPSYHIYRAEGLEIKYKRIKPHNTPPAKKKLAN